MCFDDSLLAGALASVDADDWVADLETRATWWTSNFPILLFVAVSNDTRCEIPSPYLDAATLLAFPTAFRQSLY